jgi:hypothetical protein
MSRSILVFGAVAAVLAAAVPLEPTYYRDIVPILEKRCYECHRPGGSAMSLANYRDARHWARPMREVVMNNRMPPQPPQGLIRRLQEGHVLSHEEIQTIVRWVDTGAKEGNPNEAPPPPIVAHL